MGYLLLSSGESGTKYRLLFENAGQLVPGNQVLIGGAPSGSIESIELDEDSQAAITIEMEEPLREGTKAVIRSTSLSGIANRYISITPGPDNLPELEDGALITQVDTTSIVDLDQLFDTFNRPTRKALRDVIQGSAAVYTGRAEEANETYRYFSPALSSTTRLLRELNRDQKVLADFLVNGARVTTAIAERRDDLSGLVSNTNQALGAVATEADALDRTLVALPPALRQANTTFVNLRAALDDLDPLVETSKPATKNLAPFLRRLETVARRSVPVFGDLRLAVNRRGEANDLADATGDLVPIGNQASTAFPRAIDAMQESEPVLADIRPYSPDIMSALGNLGEITANYDANGHYARALAYLPTFEYQPTGATTGELEPWTPPPGEDYPWTDISLIDFDLFHRCPGSATQPNPGWPAPMDHPFLDEGNLLSPAPPGDCTATDVPPGP